MANEIALRKYEDFMLGKSPFMLKGPSFIEQESTYDGEGNEYERRQREQKIKDAKEDDALAIVRYAITSFLGWSPEDALFSLTPEIMEQLKLDKINAYIQYPKDLSKSKDVAWMVHKAFPDDTSYNLKDQVLEMYDRLKRGEIDRFPKRTFEGTYGIEKLTILLMDFITKNIPALSIDELYAFFGNSGEANEILKKVKLYYAYRDHFNTPLDYLHESLGDSGDAFLYYHYQYVNVFNDTKSEIKSCEKDLMEELIKLEKKLSRLKNPCERLNSIERELIAVESEIMPFMSDSIVNKVLDLKEDISQKNKK